MPATAARDEPAPHTRDAMPREAGVAERAALLAGRLADGDLIFAAADDARAAGVAHALAAFVPDALVLCCPGSDALPGDEAPASPANVGQRVSALHRLGQATAAEGARPRIALVTTGEALGHLYAAPAAFVSPPPRARVGEAIDLAALHDELVALGYVADERVDEVGEVALRGRVLDVFPADSEEPLRLEADHGVLVGLRRYDPADQRSIGPLDEHCFGRVAEPAPGDAPVTLIDHLPGALLVVEPAADERRTRFLALAADAAEHRPGRARRAVADEATWRAEVAGRAVAEGTEVGGDLPPRFCEGRAPVRAFAKLARAAEAAGERVLLLGSARDLRFLGRRAAAVLGREVRAVAAWAEAEAAPAGSLLALPLAAERGFRAAGIVAVAAADLIGSRAGRDDGHHHADAARLLSPEVRIGDVVVHEDHGIGVVAGLEAAGAQGDAIRLRHACGTVRLVPVAEADRIWRYGAEADAVTLDRLDGAGWAKRRAEIDAAIAASARALTALATERERRGAPVLAPDAAAYERFRSGFAFGETPDQARAIAAVAHDLASGRPMDRLVVGDVGYGKTEVALRAAAIAALAGHQVAIAAPTTVLARQHLQVFRARFARVGIEVAGLSRLTSAAERKRVKAGLADGSVRIVVGTGAVAGKGIAYANLGLVVIDEEQRFGAGDKDRLRALSEGHMLALSATPIPRTLQSALVGLQQLSVIATPPARRQPIRTAVGELDPAGLRTALLRERARGGQSFVVVPRIEDMAPLAAMLGGLVPELTIAQAHGKMAPSAIDEAMVRFAAGDGDVLLATNIIEAGLDVPRANTMAVVHADRFGLSQLHQLRGRVGRGGRRGQVMLLTEPGHPIAAHTLKRLRALEAFDQLGAGFAISARDLDMRGAGDLVGETQAGHMKLIGVDLYQQLFAAALRSARGETVERWTPVLELGIAAHLPEQWIADEEIRVALYMRLAHLADGAAVDALEDEVEDRFGALPAEARALLAVARLRVEARAAGIARVVAGPGAIALDPRPGLHVPDLPDELEEKGGRLLLRERIADPAERLARATEIVHRLIEAGGARPIRGRAGAADGQRLAATA